MKLPKQRRLSKNLNRTAPQTLHPNEPIVAERVADIAIEIWRIDKRAKKDGCSEHVLAACERAFDKLREMGFELDSLDGRPYDENLRIRVVEHESAEGPMRVSECLKPAVYYHETLMIEADVVTRGTQ